MGFLKWNRRGGEGFVSSLSIAGIDVTAFVGDPHKRARCELECTSDMLGAAESEAQDYLRKMHAGLSEHFAPVLRWREMREGRLLGVLGDWALDAYEDQFVVLYRNIDLGGGRAADLASAQASAMERLRKIGVAFRVEREDGE